MTDWRIFDLHITATSPLNLGNESRVGNFLYTREAITGASLRAAVADRALTACTQPAYKSNHAQCPDRDECPFWQIFGGDAEPQFGFAYPGESSPTYPFPLSARTCKYYPGYQTDDDEAAHGIYDTLIDQFVYNLLSDPQFPQRTQLQPSLADRWATLEKPLVETCPNCKGALEPAKGTYVLDQETPRYSGKKLSVRRATHVGINRARAVAEDSLLFTVETIDPAAESLNFHARVVTPEEKVDVLRDYIKGSYYVGSGRSRGLGGVDFWGEEQEEFDNLQSRLNRFKLAVQATLSSYESQDKDVNIGLPGTLFTLTLRSPAILESFAGPVIIPEPEQLGVPQANLLQAWARTEIVTGWDSAACLPRRTRLAVQRGSVFLYWVPADIEQTVLIQQLTTIETEGIGAERPRGYGQVTVCAPFHLHHRLGLQ